MPSIYVCPKCKRKYRINYDGEYICECGNKFSYPPVLSTERACYISLDVLKINTKQENGQSMWRRLTGEHVKNLDDVFKLDLERAIDDVGVKGLRVIVACDSYASKKKRWYL